MVMRPPSGVNFTALASRIFRIFSIAGRSPYRTGLENVSRRIEIALSSAAGLIRFTACSRIGSISNRALFKRVWPASSSDMASTSLITPSRYWPLSFIPRQYSTYFLLLQPRDVGTDGDIPAILRAPLVDLEPTSVGELRLVGASAR